VFGVNHRNARLYKTLAGLLRMNPEIAKRAAKLYPKKENQKP
jgi:hypothetical protein